MTHETEGFGFPIVVHGRTAFNPSIISTFIGGRVILGPKNLKDKIQGEMKLRDTTMRQIQKIYEEICWFFLCIAEK